MTINFLQAPNAGAGGGFPMWVLMLGMFVITYFFFILPQKRKQKDEKKFSNEIKKGDKVVTIGGIHGRISGTEGDAVIIEVDKGIKIKMEKTSISKELTKKANTASTEAKS